MAQALRKMLVSTHSRAKAAGTNRVEIHIIYSVSTHSRAKAAGGVCAANLLFGAVSTHSRAKAAGVWHSEYGAVVADLFVLQGDDGHLLGSGSYTTPRMAL